MTVLKLAKGQTLFSPPPMKTCHDIRRWTACGACSHLGSQDVMLKAKDGEYWHGRCFAKKFGVDALLALPMAQTEKLTLGDLGVDLMCQLIDRAGRSGIFRDHSCWKCKDGAQPCIAGSPNRCEYPHARND